MAKPKRAPPPPPDAVPLADDPDERVETFDAAPGGGLFAQLPGKLRRMEPDAFRRKEDHIRSLFKKRYPGEALLRQESFDRSVVRYYRS